MAFEPTTICAKLLSRNEFGTISCHKHTQNLNPEYLPLAETRIHATKFKLVNARIHWNSQVNNKIPRVLYIQSGSAVQE